jgi:hypothetical protein
LNKQKADEKARAIDAQQKEFEKVHSVELLLKAMKEKGADKKAAPPPAAPDVEALSRQLEHLSAELIELRKRLEAGKK